MYCVKVCVLCVVASGYVYVVFGDVCALRENSRSCFDVCIVCTPMCNICRVVRTCVSYGCVAGQLSVYKYGTKGRGE